MALNPSAVKKRKGSKVGQEEKEKDGPKHNTTFTFRIAEEELEQLQDILDAQPRKKRGTVAGICRKAIADYIAKNG